MLPIPLSSAERPVRHLLDACIPALLAGALAAVTLVGYIGRIPSLVMMRPGLPAMSPLTASAVLLLALGVLLSATRQLRPARWAAGGAAALAMVVMASRILGDGDAVSPWVERHLFGLSTRPGQMALATASCVLLVAGSILLRRRHPRLSNTCSGWTLVITGTVLTSFAYTPDDIYAITFFSGVAVHTAAALFLLAGASIFIESRSGWAAIITSPQAGGGATRRQLLFALMPPIAGWLLLQLTGSDRLGLGAAMTLLVVATVVPLALLVLRDGQGLIALDLARQAGADLQKAHAEDLAEQLRRQALELERQTEQRLKAEAAVAASQRLETVGQLTGGIAHDFNNLLMGISGNLQLLRRKLPEDHPLLRYAVNASAAVDRGAKLTAQLLTFSRSQRLDIRPVAIRPQLAQTRELIGHALGPHIDLEVIDGSGEAWARTDSDQLELALLNLVINARDAMPQGGRVVIESQSLMHAFAGGEPRPAVAIRVIDNGVGMTPEVAAHAIEPFFTTKERGKGTGLGLAQAHGFALQCGGDLRLRTAPGEGTTVEILLPQTEAGAAAAPAAAAGALHSPAEVASRRQRLLVIDDDDDVRLVITELLTSSGFDVTAAADGAAGLAQLESWKPDAAVIDFLMPGMNGAEVAQRAQARYPGLPILFVSGYSDTVALDGIAQARVLRKPFDGDSLQQAVSQLLH